MMASNQAAVVAPKPLATMTKLSPFVSFYEPFTATSKSLADCKEPKLVIIAAWMNARDIHIAKYATQYQIIYPNSHILLIKFVFRQIVKESEAVKLVQPAAEYLQVKTSSGYLSTNPTQPEILLHIFSNGGMASSRHLFDAYTERTGHAFPLHTAVYDSCPTMAYDYWAGYHATIAGIPKGLRRLLAAPFIHLLDIWGWISAVLLRRPYAPLVNAGIHNDTERTRQSNRSYVYGTKDIMVRWENIEVHAKQAEAQGYVVRREMFTDSAHVSHVRVDATRYWKIVMETWNTARKTM